MKRTLALLFSIMIIVSLAACGGSGTPSPNPPPANTPDTNTPGSNTPPSTSTPEPSTPPASTAKYTTENMNGRPAANAKYGGHFKYLPRPATNMAKPLGLPWDHMLGGAPSLLNPFCETLLLEDFTEGFVGWLAESWESYPDKNEVVFKLREDVKFTDGSDFDAEAVVWCIYKGIEAKAMNPSVIGAEARSKYEVAVLMNEFTHYVWWSFATRPFGFVSKENYEKNGHDYAEMNPVGTGPFVLKEFNSGISSSFVKNENYWIEGRPYLDSIEYIAVTDPLVQSALMQTTGSDSIDLLISSNPEQMQLLEQTADVNLFKLAVGPQVLAPSSRNADSPFANILVREALSYAIDRDALIEARGFGMLTAEYQFLPNMPGVPGRLPDADYITPFDPEKAKELLASAGYPNGFKTTSFSSANGDRDIPIAIQGMLLDVGIDVTAEFPESGALSNMSTNAGWEGLYYGGIRIFTNLFRTFSLTLDTEYLQFVSTWRPVDEMRPIYNKAVSLPTLDGDLAKELNKLIMDNWSVIPLYVTYDTFITKDYVMDTGIGNYGQGNDWMIGSVWLNK